ncbi:hypothetical protein E4T56_gene5369 [Termitomyces sp. T112]|nr:hypothetical protein E4T56_gene5369 [Termitomyces sp. T112]
MTLSRFWREAASLIVLALPCSVRCMRSTRPICSDVYGAANSRFAPVAASHVSICRLLSSPSWPAWRAENASDFDLSGIAHGMFV